MSAPTLTDGRKHLVTDMQMRDVDELNATMAGLEGDDASMALSRGIKVRALADRPLASPSMGLSQSLKVRQFDEA